MIIKLLHNSKQLCKEEHSAYYTNIYRVKMLQI